MGIYLSVITPQEAVGDKLDRRWTLCLLLLLERARGAQSFWAAYIDALPTSYSDPLWWGQEALSLLEGTRLEAGVEHYSNEVKQLGLWRQQLCELQAELGGPSTLQDGAAGWAMTDEALIWAKSTVWSRAFNIPYLGAPGKAGIALIPFADMLDHSHDRHMAWHTGSSGRDPFTFITHTPISKARPDLEFFN
ncbi:g8333 [Coccomyxa viridis]|uniref:G8333 protein n=1 Tax=Coccomyxa viridis TaxID=1274662 RepID=A0ABP1G034_9CHLO